MGRIRVFNPSNCQLVGEVLGKIMQDLKFTPASLQSSTWFHVAAACLLILLVLQYFQQKHFAVHDLIIFKEF